MQRDTLLGRGAQSSVYSLKKPHQNKVVKVLSSSGDSIEKKVYDRLSQLPAPQRQWFCRRWPSPHPSSSMLVLSRCSPVDDWKKLDNVVACLRDVSPSLEVLSSLGIVHHDVHPENIMWDPRQKRHVLLDFGIATMDSTDVVDRLYLETREDHYSLLYHLLTRKYPRCAIQNDYRRVRQRWRHYFQEHPEDWKIFRRRFRRAFPGLYSPRVSTFLSRILNTECALASDDRETSILTKMMLSRFHLLFCLWNTIPASFREAVLPYYGNHLNMRGKK
jgi:hypothetical protein